MNRGAGGRVLWVVALIAAAASSGALFPGFIHDDHRIIEQNELVHDLGRASDVLTSGYWTVGDTPVPNLYRPITILSFALNHVLGGAAPFGYRLVNLLLHVLVSVGVLLLGRRLFPADGERRPLDPALFSALLFAVHPVHTEVLGEVIGRAELLAAIGTLGCVLAFLNGRAREAVNAGAARRWYAIALAAFMLGFLSKENAVAAPFLVLAADLCVVRRRPRWGFHLALAGVLGLCFGLRFAVLGSVFPAGQTHFIDNPIAHLPFLEGRLTALGVIARYAGLLLFPLRLSIDYSFNAVPAASGFLEGPVLIGTAIIAAWLAGLLLAWRRHPALGFALAWIGLAMAPTANLIAPIGTLMAERLLYLPSIGFCLVIAAGLSSVVLLPDRRAVRGAMAIRVAGVMVLILLAGRGIVRFGDWRDDRTIFQRAVEVVPDSVRARYNYGTASEEAGDDAGAMRSYRAAVDLWPRFSDAQYNLAGLLARQSRWNDAVLHYRLALDEQPANLQYLVNLGQSLTAGGNPIEALPVLRRAIAIDPGSDRAFTNLGAAYLALGDAESALAAYREALRLSPGTAGYYRNVGLALEESGDFTGASGLYRQGLSVQADDPELHMALGLSQLRGEDAIGAIESLQAAVRLHPRHPVLRYQLGRALESGGSPDAAAGAYRESIRLAPNTPVPYRSLGLLLERTGDPAGARIALERCAALDPSGRVMDDTARAALERLIGGAAADR